MRNHASWNIVSMSCTDAVPRTPSPLPSMPAATLTFLPASFLPSATALNDPTPLRDMTTELRSALITSASGTSDSPPAERAAKSTSSALKSVGLSSTFAPFDSVHSVIPVSGRERSATILPGAGGAGTSAASEDESTYAVSEVRGPRAENPRRVGGRRRGGERPEHRGGRRHVDVGLLRRGDQYDAVLVAERRLRERVDFGEGDRRCERLRERLLLLDPHDRRVPERAAHVLFHVARGVRLLPFRELLFHRSQDVGALAVEFGLREAEPRNALRFGQHCLRGLFEAALLHASEQLAGVLRPHERAMPALRERERRVGALRDLGKTCVDHPVVQRLDQRAAEIRDRVHTVARLEPEENDRGERILLVRLDGDG